MQQIFYFNPKIFPSPFQIRKRQIRESFEQIKSLLIQITCKHDHFYSDEFHKNIIYLFFIILTHCNCSVMDWPQVFSYLFSSKEQVCSFPVIPFLMFMNMFMNINKYHCIKNSNSDYQLICPHKMKNNKT